MLGLSAALVLRTRTRSSTTRASGGVASTRHLAYPSAYDIALDVATGVVAPVPAGRRCSQGTRLENDILDVRRGGGPGSSWTAAVRRAGGRTRPGATRVDSACPGPSRSSASASGPFGRTRRSSGGCARRRPNSTYGEAQVKAQGEAQSTSGGEVLGVDDPVGVALLGEEALPVLGELGVDGVAGDDRVEVRGLALGLGAQQPAEPLRLLLPGAERARTPGSPPRPQGRSIEKFATLETTSSPISPVRNASKSRCRSLTVVSPLITGASRRVGELVELVDVLPDDQRRLARVLGDQLSRPRRSCGACRPRAGSAPRARRSRRPAARRSAASPAPRRSRPGAIQPCDSMSFHGAS